MENASTAKPKTFPVIELFGPTIQGEGIMAGSKTLFIRFGGCDYRCIHCDSMHAVHPRAVKKHAKWLNAIEIAEACRELQIQTGVQWVTFSGGNPCMLQLQELVTYLHMSGMRVNVETQGTLHPEWLRQVDVVTISPKTPGMGEKFEEKKFREFLSMMTFHQRQVCLKMVVFDQVDLEFCLQVGSIWNKTPLMMMPKYLSLGNKYHPVLDEELNLVENSEEFDTEVDIRLELLTEFRVLAEDICQDPRFVDWRFLPQLHVLVWGNESER